MKLISLHLPKTAGTSFGKSLEEKFNKSFLNDYGDQGISKPEYIRNKNALLSSIEIANKGLTNTNCIHGHFLPIKYLLFSTVQKLTFITWMRDPVQRMISHYNFWQNIYDTKTAAPHHKQVIEEKWTLEQFCLSPKFRNIYCQYLWGFPLEYFEFIGITEFYEDDLLYFGEKYLNTTLQYKVLNTSNKKTSEYAIDSKLYTKIKEYHKDDMALYKRALDLRKTRCKKTSKKLDQVNH